MVSPPGNNCDKSTPLLETLSIWWGVKVCNLDRVRFHDLRHTFASLALLRGAKTKVISEALGHASVAFTIDTYSYIISGMQEDMMALLDEVLPPGIPPTSNHRQEMQVHDSKPA